MIGKRKKKAPTQRPSQKSGNYQPRAFNSEKASSGYAPSAPPARDAHAAAVTGQVPGPKGWGGPGGARPTGNGGGANGGRANLRPAGAVAAPAGAAAAVASRQFDASSATNLMQHQSTNALSHESTSALTHHATDAAATEAVAAEAAIGTEAAAAALSLIHI